MIVYRTAGFDAVRSRLRGIHRRISNSSGPMRTSLEALRGWIKANIQEGGRRVGGWLPLAPSTVRRKAPLSTGPLVRTGRLRDDWQARVVGKRGILRAGAPYAVFHQRGTRWMPARRLLPTNSQAEALIRPIWGRHVSVAIRG